MLTSLGRLILFGVLGGAASILSGKDVNWDLRNYHFYNPWAALNGRLGWDIAPAQIQTFLNPVADFPFYFLVTAPLPDYAVSFLMGVPFGCTAYFFCQIARRIRQEIDPQRKIRGFALACALLGLTGAAGLSQIGATTNEWLVAALLLGGIYFLIESLWGTNPDSGRRLFLAGLLTGMACGAKLTAAAYGAALFVMLVVLAVLRHMSWRAFVQFCLAASAGFLALAGPWMWALYQHYGSPMFPFFNGFFQAPLFPAENWRDTRFLPQSWGDTVLFPMRLAQHGTVSNEQPLRDARTLAFFAVWGSFLLWRLVQFRAPGARFRAALKTEMPVTLFLCGLGLTSFLLWVRIFAIYRYAVVLELVFSLLIAAGIVLAIRNRRASQVAMWAAVMGLVGLTEYPLPARIPHTGERYFDDAVPGLPRGSLVVMLVKGEPAGHLAPGFGSDTRFVNPESNFTYPASTVSLADRDIDFTHLTLPSFNPAAQAEIRKVVVGHPGPVFVMRFEDPLRNSERLLMAYYRRAIRQDRCQPVRTRFIDGLVVCETALARD